jgi:hypothetical protein
LQLCDRTSTLLFVQKPKMLVANGWGWDDGCSVSRLTTPNVKCMLRVLEIYEVIVHRQIYCGIRPDLRIYRWVTSETNGHFSPPTWRTVRKGDLTSSFFLGGGWWQNGEQDFSWFVVQFFSISTSRTWFCSYLIRTLLFNASFGRAKPCRLIRKLKIGRSQTVQTASTPKTAQNKRTTFLFFQFHSNSGLF